MENPFEVIMDKIDTMQASINNLQEQVKKLKIVSVQQEASEKWLNKKDLEQILNCSYQTIKKRYADFPAPINTTSSNELKQWRKTEVQAWLANYK